MWTETLWMMLQQTTSINDWCSSRGTSNVQNAHTHTHRHAHIRTYRRKLKNIASGPCDRIYCSIHFKSVHKHGNMCQSDIQVQFLDVVLLTYLTAEYLESKARVQPSDDSFKNTVCYYSLNRFATKNKGQLLFFRLAIQNIWGRNKNTRYKMNYKTARIIK